MKSFVTTALIVLAAVFCVSHVDGSRVSSVRSVEKRQVPLPPVRVSICSDTELQRRNDSLRCSNASVGQQLLNVFAECGHSNEALRKEQECGRNPRGGFCYELNSNTTVTGLVNSVVNCFRSRSCFFCNNSLQQLRDNTGCCANYLLTNANMYFQPGQQRIFNPWSFCNFQPPNNCSSTLRFVQRPNEMVCSQPEITYRINRLFCNSNYITPFINIVRSCGFEETARSMINNCGVNRYERFCFEARANASRLANEVGDQCFTNAETCPVSCKAMLDVYRTGADCCLNNLYNNPQSSNLRTTNPMLWSLCGISNPGFCQNTIDSSSAYSITLQVSVAVTGLSAIIAMLV